MKNNCFFCTKKKVIKCARKRFSFIKFLDALPQWYFSFVRKKFEKIINCFGMMNWNYNIIVMITIFQVFWNEKVFHNSFLCLFSTGWKTWYFQVIFLIIFVHLLMPYQNRLAYCSKKVMWSESLRNFSLLIWTYPYMIYSANSTVFKFHSPNFISIKGTNGFSETPPNSNNVMTATKWKCVYA